MLLHFKGGLTQVGEFFLRLHAPLQEEERASLKQLLTRRPGLCPTVRPLSGMAQVASISNAAMLALALPTCGLNSRLCPTISIAEFED